MAEPRLYAFDIFYLSYFPYGGQNGSRLRSMQEYQKGQRIWV
jgi:hypothetical protein